MVLVKEKQNSIPKVHVLQVVRKTISPEFDLKAHQASEVPILIEQEFENERQRCLPRSPQEHFDGRHQ